MKKMTWKWAALFVGLVVLSSCGDKDPEPDPIPGPDPNSEVSAETQYRNAFANLLMTDIYLWNKEALAIHTSQNIDLSQEADPIELYSKYVYKEDYWSQMTNDVAAMNSSFSGVLTTYGYSLIFGRFTDADKKPTGDVFAIVKYVYPNTPAEVAGIKRGDIIVKMNGATIPEAALSDLYYAPSIQLEFGVSTPTGIALTGKSATMTAIQMYEDPVVYHDIIEKAGKKIAYLFYTDYLILSHPKLQEVFGEFKAAGVDEVILDLRYNGGGTAITSQLLCDILAPKSALDNMEIMTKEVWNSDYRSQNTITYYGYKVGTEMITANMDLKRLYVLTGEGTASASESTIIGLKPHLELIQIGQTTHGKYCGGIVFDRDIIDKNQSPAAYKALDNWGAYTMVYKFTNKNNETFANGLVPNYAAQEDYFSLLPIGDERDPLLGKALEIITGVPSAITKSSGLPSADFIPVSGAKSKTNRIDGKMIDLRTLDEIKNIQ